LICLYLYICFLYLLFCCSWASRVRS
jgi:hypothetical protein